MSCNKTLLCRRQHTVVNSSSKTETGATEHIKTTVYMNTQFGILKQYAVSDKSIEASYYGIRRTNIITSN